MSLLAPLTYQKSFKIALCSLSGFCSYLSHCLKSRLALSEGELLGAGCDIESSRGDLLFEVSLRQEASLNEILQAMHSLTADLPAVQLLQWRTNPAAGLHV